MGYDIDDVKITRWNKLVKTVPLDELSKTTTNTDKLVSYTKISEELHLTRERIRQIEKNALKKMREFLEKSNDLTR